MQWNDILDQNLAIRILQAHRAQNKLGRAYLFVGIDGIGKRSLANVLASALNCTEADGPCGVCKSCQQIERDAHPDIHRLAPEGASEQIKIHDVRQLLSRVALRPFYGKMHVVVIERADRFTEEAANSLLKALEEPSEKTMFLLTAIELKRCLPTIVSRCQVLHCRCLQESSLIQILQQQEACVPEQAAAIARMSDGSAAKALTLAKAWKDVQQINSHCRQDARAWLEQPLPDSRQTVAPWLESMTLWLRDVIVTGVAGELQVKNTEYQETVIEQANQWDRQRCIEAAFKLMELRESLDRYANAKLVASLAREEWLSLLSAEA